MQCYQPGGFSGCLRGQVVIKYQCLGNLDAQRAYTSAPVQVAPSNGSLGKSQWQEQQLQQLQATPMSYEEYQRRYREIVGQ
ncbi:hypothetical protein D3C76_1461620 [compost metagenome]